MVFSDELIGLDIRHRRELKQTIDGAQGIINGQATDVALLTSALRKSRKELAAANVALHSERRQRMALQLQIDRLNKLLDTPIGCTSHHQK